MFFFFFHFHSQLNRLQTKELEIHIKKFFYNNSKRIKFIVLDTRTRRLLELNNINQTMRQKEVTNINQKSFNHAKIYRRGRQTDRQKIDCDERSDRR